MAKTSVKIRNQRRIQLSERMKNTRTALKETIRTDEENRDEAIDKLQKRRRNESPIRIRNRCRECGRSRGTLRRFGLCRIHLREAAMRGDVPGLRKASW
jgi:small subunit ribosomal protein S14